MWQPHSQPCLQLQRRALAQGLDQPPRAAQALPKRTFSIQGVLRTQNVSFPALVPLALLRLCSSLIHHPSSALLPRDHPQGAACSQWPCLACFTPRLPQTTHFLQLLRPDPCRCVVMLGTDLKALQWLGWPQLGQLMGYGEAGRKAGLTSFPFPPCLIWPGTMRVLPPPGHRA